GKTDRRTAPRTAISCDTNYTGTAAMVAAVVATMAAARAMATATVTAGVPAAGATKSPLWRRPPLPPPPPPRPAPPPPTTPAPRPPLLQRRLRRSLCLRAAAAPRLAGSPARRRLRLRPARRRHVLRHLPRHDGEQLPIVLLRPTRNGRSAPRGAGVDDGSPAA